MSTTDPGHDPAAPLPRRRLRWLRWLVLTLAIGALLLYLPTTARVNGEPIPGGVGYLIGLLLTLVCVIAIVTKLLALTAHAFAQAAMASWLGDPTPRQWRRLPPNPLRHFDAAGWLLFFVASVGWPRAVPVVGPNLRHGRLGWLLSVAAGTIPQIRRALPDCNGPALRGIHSRSQAARVIQPWHPPH